MPFRISVVSMSSAWWDTIVLSIKDVHTRFDDIDVVIGYLAETVHNISGVEDVRMVGRDRALDNASIYVGE